MRITQIQGLRAFAAIVVILFHARLLGGGFVGVDIFYVISGYLITGLLTREITKTGTVNFKKFYIRRSKRLLPSSAVVLISTGFAAWIFLPANTRGSIGRDVIAASLYISNYLFAWWQNDYQNLNATPSPVIHYWSLAVEEQFYLIWPLFIFALSRMKSKNAILKGVLLSTCGSFLFSLYETTHAPIWAFYSLPTRAWELGLGALICLSPKTGLKNKLFAWVGVACVIYSSWRFDSSTPFPGIAALAPVVGICLLISSIQSWPPLLNDLANSRISQWLGAISYPLYLWHWPVLVVPSEVLGRPLHLYERVICIAITVVLADLTHRFIEDPLRRNVITSNRKIVTGALLITGLSVLLGSGISASASNTIVIETAATASAPKPVLKTFSLAEVTRKPLVYSDGCHVNYGEDTSSICEYGDLTSAKTIVLYGDSHAAQWFPTLNALAMSNHFKLVSLTKSACPSADVARTDRGAFKIKDCNQWRINSLARIAAIHPQAVILSGYQYYSVPPGYNSRNTWWNDGQARTFHSLQGASDHLIYITDTPHPLRDIPSCLAAKAGKQCDTSEPSVATVGGGFEKINPTSWLCTKKCPAIVDGLVAYRDASHLSVDIAIALAPDLLAQLQHFGVL